MGSSIAREMRFRSRAKIVGWISRAFHWLCTLKIITAIKIVAVMARLNVRFTAHLGWRLLIHWLCDS